MSILRLTDCYKLGRIMEYPEGTSLINEVLVPRDVKYFKESLLTKIKNNGIIVAGIQRAINELETQIRSHLCNWDFIEGITENPLNTINIKNDFTSILGKIPTEEYLDKFDELAQYLIDNDNLPLEYKWIEEGTLVPVGTPICTITNTDPRFYWLPNFIETLFLSECWLTLVNATVNFYTKHMLLHYADKTADDNTYVNYQAHDFSMRGNQGLSGSAQVALGQQMSFIGSDTLYGIEAIEQNYTDYNNHPICQSISAFEHSSVTTTIQHNMSKNSELSLKEAEALALTHFITNVYPDGLVAYVADSYDFWSTIDTLKDLKEVILNREGKLVIRPDSGNPHNIICGLKVTQMFVPTSIENALSEAESNFPWSMIDYFGRPDFDLIHDTKHNKFYKYYADMNEMDITKWIVEEVTVTYYEQIGLIRALDEIFGHTVNSKGYKVLNSKIGAIYGDGITYDKAEAILKRLEELGYSAENIVFGMGVGHQSHYTRDNLGLALKTTLAKIGDNYVNVVKDPKTAKDNSKKSPKGSVKVMRLEDDSIVWVDSTTATQACDAYDDLLVTDNYITWEQVKENITKSLEKVK